MLGSRSQEVAERQGLLKKLTQEEAYARHVAHDHVLYLKGCPICIGAQGRQRSHWRSSFVGVHSASFDIAGPFVSGQAYNVEASGRDKGTGYKYFLACAYTVPEGYSSRVDQVPDWKNDEYAPSESEPDVKAKETPAQPKELFPELWEPWEGSGEGGLGVKVVTHRVKKKEPEKDGQDPGELDVHDAPRAFVAPHAHDGTHLAEDFPVTKTRTLFLGVPLRTKGGKEVLLQVQGMINRLEAYGYPVQRFHADRAKELRSAALIS